MHAQPRRPLTCAGTPAPTALNVAAPPFKPLQPPAAAFTQPRSNQWINPGLAQAKRPAPATQGLPTTTAQGQPTTDASTAAAPVQRPIAAAPPAVVSLGHGMSVPDDEPTVTAHAPVATAAVGAEVRRLS